MLTVLGYLRPYWRAATLAPLLMALEVAMDLAQPLLMAHIIDQGVLRGDLDQVVHTGLWMVVCALLGLAGGFGCTLFSSRAAIDAATDLRRDLFARVQQLPLQRLDTTGQGSLLTRLTSDVAQLQQFIMMLLRVFVRSPLLALGSLLLAALIDWRLALLIVAVMPLLGGLLYWIGLRSALGFGHLQRHLDRLNEGLRETIGGMRTLKAFARTGQSRRRFNALNQQHTEAATHAWRMVALNAPTLLLLNASLVAVLFIGAGKTRAGALAVGDLVAFVSYLGIALAALSSLGQLLMQLARARIAAERVSELFADQGAAAAVAVAAGPDGAGGELLLEAVSFAYGPRPPVLSDISFRASPGQRVVLLGWTGAGKSSLLALLAGVYPASSGQVRLDGVNIEQWPEAYRHRQIGLVSQQAVLFGASVRDNLLLGRSDIDAQALAEALRIAQAEAFVEALPQGIDTVLGAGGEGLSGGQRQRLSIARALLARPSLLLLDDCSSALDPDTERRLFAALRTALPDSTWIVATQRPDTLADADWVLLLDHGRLVAQGHPAQLRETSTAYRAFLAEQPRSSAA